MEPLGARPPIGNYSDKNLRSALGVGLEEEFPKLAP